MMDKDGFTEELAALCSKYMPKARRDPDLGAEMVERLSLSLGTTISVIMAGDAKRIDAMHDAVMGYIVQASADIDPLAKFLGALSAREGE